MSAKADVLFRNDISITTLYSIVKSVFVAVMLQNGVFRGNNRMLFPKIRRFSVVAAVLQIFSIYISIVNIAVDSGIRIGPTEHSI